MSFSTPQPVPSGAAQRVLEVQGHAPTSLQDFDGDVAFVVGEDMHYLVQGCGRINGDTVRFHEKDLANNGKDIRVWQVRPEASNFVAEHLGVY